MKYKVRKIYEGDDYLVRKGESLLDPYKVNFSLGNASYEINETNYDGEFLNLDRLIENFLDVAPRMYKWSKRTTPNSADLKRSYLEAGGVPCLASLPGLVGRSGSKTRGFLVPAGVTVVLGKSGLGKSTLVNFLSDKLNVPILTFSEPVFDSISDPTSLMEQIGSFLFDDKVNNILIVDSVTALLTRIGKDDSIGSGGLSNKFLDDLAPLSTLCTLLGKSLILVLNTKTVRAEDAESIKGRAGSFILFENVGVFSYSSRVNPNDRSDYVYNLNVGIQGESTKDSLNVDEGDNTSLDIINYKTIF